MTFGWYLYVADAKVLCQFILVEGDSAMSRKKTEKPKSYFRKLRFEELPDRTMLSGGVWGDVTSFYNSYIAPVVDTVVHTVYDAGFAIYSGASNFVSSTVSYLSGSSHTSSSSSRYSTSSDSSRYSYDTSYNSSSSYNSSNDRYVSSHNNVSLGSAVVNAISSVGSFVASTVNTVVDAATGAIDVVSDVVQSGTATVVFAVNSVANTIVDTASTVVNSVVSTADEIIEAVDAVMADVGSVISGHIEPVVGTLHLIEQTAEAVAKNAADNTENFASAVFDSINSGAIVATQIVDTTIDSANEAKEFAVDFAAGAVKTAKQVIEPVVNNVAEKIVSISDQFLTDPDTAIKELIRETVDSAIFVDNIVPIAQIVAGKDSETAKMAEQAVETAIAPIEDFVGNVAVSVYNGIKNIALGLGALAVDAASITPVGIAISPDNAAKTVEKWENIIGTVATNPGVIFEAVADQYKKEYDENGIGGVFGMGIVDGGSLLIGAGGAKVAAKGGELATGIGKVAEVAKVAKVVKVKKFTLLAGEIDKAGNIIIGTEAANKNFRLGGNSIRDLIGEKTFIQPSTGNLKKIGGEIHTTVDLAKGEAHLTTQIPLFAEHTGADGVATRIKNLADGTKLVEQFNPKSGVFEKVAPKTTTMDTTKKVVSAVKLVKTAFKSVSTDIKNTLSKVFRF